MPLAPPVTIATRPSSRPMTSNLLALAFRSYSLDERGEGRKLLGDESDRLLVGNLAGLGIDFLRAVADEDLRLVERHGVEENHRAAQVILHAPAAERAIRRRLKRDRLAGKRLILHPRHPVDRVFQAARHREIV